MNSWMSDARAALLGAAGWTFAEYGLHRWAMHVMGGRGLASVEHLKHHADVTYFAPTDKKLLSAASTTAVAFPAASAIAGRRWATAFTTGLIGTYFAYEVAHRRTHTHPPRNRYGRWARRSHMYHHFGAPMRNFGVTSPVWDRVFRTYDEPGVIVVPQRMAPVWMTDPSGTVRPEFAGDYVVKAGRTRDREQLEVDRRDAFSNAVPAT